jgi:hypothetical protein
MEGIGILGVFQNSTITMLPGARRSQCALVRLAANDATKYFGERRADVVVVDHRR